MRNKRTLVLLGAVAVLLLLGIPVSIFFVTSPKPQDVRSRAQESPTATPACQPPATVTNVKVEYPNCVGNQCQFDQASCSWDSISGAVTYSVKVTEVDTSKVVKSESVSSSTTRVTFPITNGNTYKCEITAVNSCGQSGGTGSDSLLCKTDGLFPTNTPAPPTPTTPPPTGVPPTPAPAALTCGTAGCSATAPCQSGLVCITANNGTSYCAMSAFQSACKLTPNIVSCCQAPILPTATPSATLTPTLIPTRAPTLVPPGDLSNSLIFGIGGVATIILGGIMFVLLSL